MSRSWGRAFDPAHGDPAGERFRFTGAEQYGGSGRDLLDAILCLEQLARVSPLCAAGVFESNVGPVRVIERIPTGVEELQKFDEPAYIRRGIDIPVSSRVVENEPPQSREKIDKADPTWRH